MQIIPIRDLKNTVEVERRCAEENGPVFITKNGYGRLVVMDIDYYEKTGKIEHLECPKCGKQLIFNVRTEETKSIYIEGAYLNSWASYTKWLQNTLNKKLLY